MRELALDGADWLTRDDVYDAFFRAVGGPEWHGRNFDGVTRQYLCRFDQSVGSSLPDRD